MKKILTIVFASLAVLLVILLVGPFLIPISPPEGVVPIAELADEDSQFAQTPGGVNTHFKTSGSAGPAVVLLHGFGASLYSWQEIMPALGQAYTVYAYDRPPSA